MEKFSNEDLEEAVRVLKEGGVILYPTDTVWGIGCDATNAEAVQRIYDIKHRSDSKAMLVLLDGPGKLQGYVDVPEAAWMLLEATKYDHHEPAKCDQRPMTIIYPNAHNLAHNLVAEDGSIGIRITEEPFSKALCERLHHPLVSTSANVSGEPTAKTFHQISEKVRSQMDYICQYRQDDTEEKRPSAIIKVDAENVIRVIR